MAFPSLSFKKIYLLILKAELQTEKRDTETEISICCFTLQKAMMARAEDWSQRLKTGTKSFLQVSYMDTEAQSLGPCSTTLAGMFTGSWIGRGAGRTCTKGLLASQATV